MKKWLVLGFAVLVIGIASQYFSIGHHGFDITIKNESSEEISGLKLTYNNITSDITIPVIGPGKEVSLNVNPEEEFGENSMNLLYPDKEGNIHEETVFGYFEQGYYGEAIITIMKVDESGVIHMDIEESMFE
jgi:hypothetical protein